MERGFHLKSCFQITVVHDEIVSGIRLLAIGAKSPQTNKMPNITSNTAKNAHER
jgi:hypothetical protein